MGSTLLSCLWTPGFGIGIKTQLRKHKHSATATVNSSIGGSGDPVKKRLIDVGKSFKNVRDLELVINDLSQAKVVILGESHPTLEFHRWRRSISEELISKHGFTAVAMQSNWRESRCVDDFITRGQAAMVDVLQNFRAWPTWPYANSEFVAFIEWLREYNADHRTPMPVHFYGLNLFCLTQAIEDGMASLTELDPALATRAADRYKCFEPYLNRETSYASAHSLDWRSCQPGAVSALVELEQRRQKGEVWFQALQNARIVCHAEAYYRMVGMQPVSAWNIEQLHLLDTLLEILQHQGPHAKAIVWGHNLITGDHRGTGLFANGNLTLGGLARAALGYNAVKLVGFSSYQGTTFASRTWEGRGEILPVAPAPPDWWETQFHMVGKVIGTDKVAFMFHPEDHEEGCLAAEMRFLRGAKGVYKPGQNSLMRDTLTCLARRFNTMIFFDKTVALEPLPGAEEMTHRDPSQPY